MVGNRKHKIFLIIILLFIIGLQQSYCQTNKILSNKATYYHDMFENRRTSSGEIFSQKLYTAAHNTLPLHTIAKITNKNTGRSVLVKINDRCPRRGIIDLSKSAFKHLGLVGTTQVSVEVLGKDYLDIWHIQDSLIKKTNLTYQMQTTHIDSLINERKLSQNAMFYIRLTTVAGLEEAQNILANMSKSYSSITKIEKIYNENFYYVNIGPFPSKEEANIAINELKKEYPLAHLIRKNKE